MSDYLGNLVTRTLSQAGIVRPQLPSLFEPSPASGQIRSELKFEPETFAESPPNPQRAAGAASNQAPQQSRLGELESTPITHRSETPALSSPLLVSPRQPAIGEPPPASILAPHQFVGREPEPTIQASRPQKIRHATEEPEPSPKDVGQRPAGKRPESRSIPVRVETRVEPVTPELRKNDSDAGQRESSPRRARASEARTSLSQLSTPDSQLKSPSLVRPAVPVQKIRAVQAVVPAIRGLPQFPSTPAPAPVPTINVTIGRVEIRATSPAPTPAQRARPKSGNVLSLEEYLRRRASGGSQ